MKNFRIHCRLGMAALPICAILPVFAEQAAGAPPPQQTPNALLAQADATAPAPGVSPVRRIVRDPAAPVQAPLNDHFRSIDGSGNNALVPSAGAAGIALLRLVPPDYADGIAALAGADRPSARAISNTVSAQNESIPNEFGASDFLWQWGQFLDHDIDLTDGIDPPEEAAIPVPSGDPFFDPEGTGNVVIDFNRSLYDLNTGTSRDNPRQQINEITSWIDASMVYGSDSVRATALRTMDGTGRLRTSEGNLLPFNEGGLANAGGSSASLFLAGDVRANEQVGLTAMHTLFVREHNRLAGQIAQDNPNLSGDEIYERARQIVGAEVQVITYREYLPLLLGPGRLAPYSGYRAEIDASIANVFATGGYRYGHSALSPTLLRLNAQGNPIAEGNLPLRDGYFSPQRITDEGGIAPVLRGLAKQVCQRIDPLVVDDVRNFLFGAPGAGGFDLAALNIQRGRDHGLPGYNEVREAYGLARAQSFAAITSSPEIRQRLQDAYASVDDVDLWVGGLAEDHLPDAMVGELVSRILKEQFEALRDGDRFWYQSILHGDTLIEVENTRLADVIRRNTNIGTEIPDNVFRVPQPQDQLAPANGA